MKRQHRLRNTEAEINITAFLNLMVVLIPFLLITAVFSQLSILQLNLPSGDQQDPPKEDKQKLVLELTIRNDKLEIGDRNSGILKVLENSDDGYAFTEAHKFLQKIKQKFPDITDITLLLEDNIEYDVLIQAMDTVRLQHSLINGRKIKTELFPDVAIGSAPPAAQANPVTTASVAKFSQSSGGNYQ